MAIVIRGLPIFFLLYVLLVGRALYSQEQRSTPHEIHSLIHVRAFAKAKNEVRKNLNFYRSHKLYDSLYRYIQFEGDLSLNNGDKNLTDEIRGTASPDFIVDVITELAWIYDDFGMLREAYDLMETAAPHAKENKEPNTDMAGVFYRLGYYASKMGDYPLAYKNYQKSLRLLKKSGQKDFVFYYQLYNALGGMMWQETKLDSLKYYFQEAIKVLEKTDEDDILNRYFPPALVKLNLSILWNALGKNREAISISEEAIKSYQEYITQSTDQTRIKKAKRDQCIVMDNRASFYNTLGEYSRSLQLLEYWAGLVLMGETTPVDLGGNTMWWWLLAGAVALGMFAIFIFDQRRK